MGLRSLARRYLPSELKASLRAWPARVSRWVLPLFARWRWSSSLYYGLFSRAFTREHFGVIQGRRAYWRSLNQDQQSYALLRRNTHRLEKGLIMRPRRAVFAEAYIEETVQMFLRAQQSKVIAAAELNWAHDVLHEYFTVVQDTPVITKARELWTTRTTADATNSGAVPYRRADAPALSVNADDLEQLFRRRRSVRWYLPEAVPEQLLTRAVNMATLAPSACNRQPYSFYVINDAARAAKVASFAGGTVGFAQQIPALIVVVGDLSAYPLERDRHCIYIDGALAAMQLMLATETLGLATCPINWPDIEQRERAMQRELQLEPYQRPIMLMAVGYADPEGGVAYSAKKDDRVLMRQ
ncbi:MULTISPECIES: nitroreductase family protein [Pseudidiomarina]|uniref:Nitroreductase-like protein n=1 Tax=Pseudidiomarina homiensis TaxID=364198 RepID=A0A432Y5I5_9GAMM|nr:MULTISPECIES: nitroreductase family protein [Pseudidiomarina]RUO56255.1 nitroreductase-like protein [Pseudidiomarina homiensis]